MFVVLRIISPEKSLSKRRKQRKIAERAVIKSYPSTKGLPFFTLDVMNEKRGINWEKVAEKCGRYSSRIVAPRSCPLPDHSRLKRFVPRLMPSLLVFNTAAETIKKAGLAPENLCITVTDRNAVHYSRICSLLPYAACVRVITAHPERYAQACEEAYTEHGASLIIRSCYEAISKHEIIICCDGAVTAAMSNAAIFSPRRKSVGKLMFSGNGILLTENHRNIIGENIDSVDFAGALTELCGSSEYKNAVFENVDISCNKCGDVSPEKCLVCALSDKTPLLINT